MLDIRTIRENPAAVKLAVLRKNDKADIDAILALDSERRETLPKVEALKAERNRVSKSIGAAIKQGKDPEAVKAEARAMGEDIQRYEERVRAIDEELRQRLLHVPNLPHSSIPVGGEEANRIERQWGEPRAFAFEPKPHWETGEALGILDVARGVKLSGSMFFALKGAGARLERALINFMLDTHTAQHGYTEVCPPFIVNRETMTGTGQLPKLENDMYRIESDDLFLIPTAEVPVTNLHRDEILPPATLPLRYVAYTPCFRREAGSHGKETRGMTRVHQFDKVEMVRIVEPHTSWDELEDLLSNAEAILRALELPYRIVTLATGDLSFAAAKCYDIEVWAPGMKAWLEVSSCSNFTDFQARRLNLRFKSAAESKPEFAHTLNASGLALPRTVIAILETYQREDGTVDVPACLRSYMGGLERIG
ncbi:MAG: Serine--tRNA ligase [candidate division BRC1 bacterium ADurb.BinA364]|nr:MAG: Serine--tRNA ligase [candidate division BRC1 bacterium ADurb.BinA364]